MPEEFSIVEKGITSALILDDDWEVSCDKDDLISSGVEAKYIDRLDDDDDDDTYDLIECLDSKGIASHTTQDKINALFDESIREDLPQSYINNIVDVATSKNVERRERLETIKLALIELGMPEQSITCASSVDIARSSIDKVYPELFIFDLYLDVGNQNLSIDLLKDIITNAPEGLSPQFILMSYDKVQLEALFREIHNELQISSSKFKVIEKPVPGAVEGDKLRWKHALYLMSHERSFMDIQFNMQLAWVNNIKATADKLIRKIWELDSCSLNKLRLTANADSLSMADYLPEIMSKHIVGEFEEAGSPKEEIKSLENALEAVNDNFTFSSSVEVVEPYETLKKLLSDIASHRSRGVVSFCPDSDEDEQQNPVKTYQKFIQELNFGTIIRRKIDNQILVHLTQPCDYIHVPYSDAIDESLLFFPGTKMSLYEDGKESNKTFITSYTRVNEEIVSMSWNLRRPTTFSIVDFFNQRNDYQIIGKLRDEYAQAICSKFASGVSRTALIKVPRFEDMECFHIYYNGETDNVCLTSEGQDIELKEDDFSFEEGIKFDARRYKNQVDQNNPKVKKYHRFTLLSHSAAEFTEHLKGAIKENTNTSLELLNGVSLGEEGGGLIPGPCGINFLHEKAFKTQFSNIKKAGQKGHRLNEPFNLVLIRQIPR
jgi:hypothetical protein